MAAPKTEKLGVNGHYRYLDGKLVLPRKFKPSNIIGGQVDDKSILDSDGKPIRYQSIGISAKEHLSNVTSN